METLSILKAMHYVSLIFAVITGLRVFVSFLGFFFHEGLKGGKGHFCVSVLLGELVAASIPCMLCGVMEGS